MNLKKFALLVLVFGFMATVVFAQEAPMRGMYVTSSNNAAYKYISIDGDRDSNTREINFYDSTGHNVVYSVTGYFINNNPLRYNFNHSRYPSGSLNFINSESFRLSPSGITYTRM